MIRNLPHAYFLIIFGIITLVLPQPVEASARAIKLDCMTTDQQAVSSAVRFFKTTSPYELKDDPTHLSLLIAFALNTRYGREDIRVKNIADLMSPLLKGDKHTFLDIKNIVKRIGYNVSAYKLQGNAQETIRRDDIGFLIDQTVLPNAQIFALLFTASSNQRYLLYADGIICPMSNEQFNKRFNNSFFLKLD